MKQETAAAGPHWAKYFESSSTPIGDVLVSIDIEQRVAYLACEHDTGIRWKQLPARDAEFLVRLGVRAQLHPGSNQLSVDIDPDTASNEAGTTTVIAES